MGRPSRARVGVTSFCRVARALFRRRPLTSGTQFKTYRKSRPDQGAYAHSTGASGHVVDVVGTVSFDRRRRRTTGRRSRFERRVVHYRQLRLIRRIIFDENRESAPLVLRSVRAMRSYAESVRTNSPVLSDRSYRLCCRLTGLRVFPGTERARRRVNPMRGAGVASWISVLPFDVIKSKVIVDSLAAEPAYRGMLDCAIKTYRDGGAARLFRGFWLMCARAFPVNGITFVVYEMLLEACAERMPAAAKESEGSKWT